MQSAPIRNALRPGFAASFTARLLAGCMIAALLAMPRPALALPQGGVIVAGTAAITATPSAMTITQSSQNAVINWQGFGIAASESVTFAQPNSQSVTLNRVLGQDPTAIMGQMSANGRVFIVNPNGILFGKGAQVNVGGLVASTLDIGDSDFMAGKMRFSGSGGTVLNEGSITSDGGFVVLMGAQVSNQGTIQARLGTVALAAGEAVTLDFSGDGLLNVAIDRGTAAALVENRGLIDAAGGRVLMTAYAAGQLIKSAVNNTGVVSAQTVATRGGVILLLADLESGTLNLSGTLDASAPDGGNGGFIETSAANVKIANGVKVTTEAAQGKTGNWLIDPPDFVIGAGGDIAGSTLGAALVTNNITILSSSGSSGTGGDIFVNDAVSWTASGTPTTLTLLAVRDVNVNAAITATKGNLVVCCGRDVNVNAKITTTNGSVLLGAGRDVNIVRSGATPLTPDKNLAGITTTDGNIEICAARDVILNNAFDPGLAPLITLTRGSVTAGQDLANLGVPRGLTLMAGTAGTGPGSAGGTVKFINGGLAGTYITTTGPAPVTPTNIFYNPTSYTTPTDYSPFFTGNGSPLNQFMLVFPEGNKTYDGTTGAILAGLKGAPAGVTLVAGPGSSATFDTPAVGTGKTITFTGYTLGGANASAYALPVSCCGPVVARTTANIKAVVPPVVVPPVVPPVVVVPPVDVLPVVPPVVPTLGNKPLPPVLTPSTPPAVVPPGYVFTVLPPAPVPPPVLVVVTPPTPPVVVPVTVPVETPLEKYQAPVRKPKPERN